MRPEEEQGQRWLIVAFVLVLGLKSLILAQWVMIGNTRSILFWLPFLLAALQIGMMCATWLGHRWARWMLFLLFLHEALLSFQLVINFSNLSIAITFSIYLVALCLVGFGTVGDFIRYQNRKHQVSLNTDPSTLPEKAAFWSVMGPAIAVVVQLSGEPVPRGGYDAGPLLGLGAMAALLAGLAMGIIAMFTAKESGRVIALRTGIAGTCLCAVVGGLWIWAANSEANQLEYVRMYAARKTKQYLPIQTTVLQFEVADQIKVELGRIAHKQPKDFDSHKPLIGQGLNDLQIVELVLAVERAFQVKVPDKRIDSKDADGSSLLTIDELADAITAEMKSKVSTLPYSPE